MRNYKKNVLIILLAVPYLVHYVNPKKIADNYCHVVTVLEAHGVRPVCKCFVCNNKKECDIYYKNI